MLSHMVSHVFHMAVLLATRLISEAEPSIVKATSAFALSPLP